MKPKVHKYANGGMVKPKKAKGGPPKKIGHDMNSPGGPHTPGAKEARRKAREKVKGNP